MMTRVLTSILALTLTSAALAHDVITTTSESFLPPNNLHLDGRRSFASNMTEQEFGDIIDGVMAIYAPQAKQYGVNLVVQKNWSNSTVNAYASQSGNTWMVAMFGGLARRTEVTDDGFALVVCHELGHHFAGFPFYAGGNWAASEGQADYFATQSCAKRLWGQDVEENADIAEAALASASADDELAIAQCDDLYMSEAARNLCIRSAMGGASLARLLGALGGQKTPMFGTPDPRVVARTSTSHPAGQCRMDTYFQGALCEARFNPGTIPGKNNPDGQESAAAEQEAAETSCMTADGYLVGARPLCWFAPGSKPADDDIFTLADRFY